MPQSSDEMQELMGLLFNGDTIGDAGPTKFLEDRGYKLLGNWLWRLPSPDHCVTEKEVLCLRFLLEEWDYGWLEPVDVAGC